MLNPLMALSGVAFAFTASTLLYLLSPLPPSQYFFAPVLFLILFHTISIQFKQTTQYKIQPLTKAFKKAFGKYLMWLGLILVLQKIYTTHPFYIRFAPNTTLLIAFFLKYYIFLALPYFVLSERYRSGWLEIQHDPYLKILSLFKSIYKKKWTQIRFRLFKKGYKSLFLSWLIRLHFIPIMVEQVFWGSKNTIEFFENWETSVLNAAVLIGILFLIDATNASIGYFWESNVTKTRFKAVDPNPFHWIVVLMCYMPFIAYASNFVPFPKGDAQSVLLFTHPYFAFAVNAVTVCVLLGIVLTTTCLGFSYSNLSYKKIQTKGPYALVRHPGTVFKIGFFFLIIFRHQSSFTLPIIAAFLFWMAVYVTRAICEERFLRQFKEYQDYMEVTPYRFIPKVY